MYNYERYNFRVITLLLGLMAFIFLMYAAYPGSIISLALAVLFSFSYTGVSIDAVKQRYIKYDRFVKFRIGKWEKLPKPNYVTLVKINLSNMRNMASPMITPEPGKRTRAYKVNLVVEGDLRFIAVCRGPLEKMKEEALKLGRELNIRVLDYTTHEKKWIL
ncbi:MAG: hypothetical protein GY790_01155 [Bacteroidetes bacterium]|nr:hypothetical protein [Bacteroidota bacterium]